MGTGCWLISLFWKKTNIARKLTAHIIISQNISPQNSAQFLLCWSTYTVGRMYPIPDPSMFQTERIAMARGRLQQTDLTFVEPGKSDLGWSIENERLASCQQGLTHYHIDKAFVYCHSDQRADKGQGPSYEHSSAQALAVQNPVRREVNRQVDYRVQQGQKVDQESGDFVVLGCIDGDGGEGDPAKPVCEGDEAEDNKHDPPVLFGPSLINHIMQSRVFRVGEASTPFNQLVKRVMSLPPALLSIEYVLSKINGSNIQKFRLLIENEKDEFSIQEFVRFFIVHNQQPPQSLLCYIMGLISLYKAIQGCRGQDCRKINFSDLTNYLCNSILRAQSSDFITFKKFPDFFKLNNFNYKDLEAPLVVEHSHFKIKRLSRSILKTDRTKHFNKSIKKGLLSLRSNCIITLDTLAPFIALFDFDLKLKKEIRPRQLVNNKQISIMDMAYSHRQGRIGAILKEIGLCFWDEVGDFTQQKNIVRNGHNIQSIWYLQFNDKWVTANRLGVLTFWNLMKEEPQFLIQPLTHPLRIADLSEITNLGLLAVASNSNGESLKQQKQKQLERTAVTRKRGLLQRRVSLWCLKTKKVKVHINIDNFSSHSLIFLSDFQVLLIAGFQMQVDIYKINHRHQDVWLCGKLKGHSGLITALCAIQNTAMVLSIDDHGVLKVWDIRSQHCVQSIETGKKIAVNSILDVHPSGSVAFMDNRINLLRFQEQPMQKSKQAQVYLRDLVFDQNREELLAITQSGFRTFSLQNGKCKLISRFNQTQSDQITSIKHTKNCLQFLVSNEAGQIRLHNRQSSEVSERLNYHGTQVCCLQTDLKNRLFLSIGLDRKLMIQKQAAKSYQQSKSKFQILRETSSLPKDVTSMQLSLHHNLLLLGSKATRLYLLDYEYLKLVKELQFPCTYQFYRLWEKRDLFGVFLTPGILLIAGFRKHEFQVSIQIIRVLLPFAHDLVRNPSLSFQSLLENQSGERALSFEVLQERLLVSSVEGRVYVFCLESLHDQVQQSESVQKKVIFSAFRRQKNNYEEDFSRSANKHLYISPPTFSVASLPFLQVYSTTHSPQEKLLFLKAYPSKKLIGTFSSLAKIKLWSLGSKMHLCCILGLYDPYPIRWQSLSNRQRVMQQQVRDGLNFMEELYKKSWALSSYQKQVIWKGKFLQKLEGQQESDHQREQVSLMRNKMKYKKELFTSLKQMEFIKRIRNMNRLSQLQQKQVREYVRDTTNEEKQHFMKLVESHQSQKIGIPYFYNENVEKFKKAIQSINQDSTTSSSELKKKKEKQREDKDKIKDRQRASSLKRFNFPQIGGKAGIGPGGISSFLQNLDSQLKKSKQRKSSTSSIRLDSLILRE